MALYTIKLSKFEVEGLTKVIGQVSQTLYALFRSLFYIEL